MQENKTVPEINNVFLGLSVGIANTALAKYKRDGYIIDDEGFYLCPECKTRATKMNSVFGCMIPCECQCKKEKREAAETEQRLRAYEERRIKCFESKEMREHRFSVDNGKNPEITVKMKSYADNFEQQKAKGRGMVLFGSTGTGKSFFASCVGNALIDKGYSVRQTTFSRLMSKMSNTYDKQTIIDSYARADLVILDDIGTERQSDYMKQIMFDTVDTFYNERTPMIVTTNLTTQEFKDPKDKELVRIYQRILEHCSWIKLENESQRVRNIIDGYNKDSELLGLDRL